MRSHDLLWTATAAALHFSDTMPDWVAAQWNPTLPLVVRRDVCTGERIPVGIRGARRGERAAAWLDAGTVVRVATPESLASGDLTGSPFAALAPVQALMLLQRAGWPWTWGVTGSCGYALATGLAVMRETSDLDLVVRCPHSVPAAALRRLADDAAALPCRADIQVETPCGAFALAEWLRGGRVMLKTGSGPRLTGYPWGEA